MIETNDTSLLYRDDTWYHQGGDTKEDLEYSFDEVVFVNDSLTTNAGDYAERISQNYDLIQVNVHSNPYHHSFDPAPSFTNLDLEAEQNNALIYNLFACSNANVAAANNMGSIYLLDNNYTQVVLGCTKSGGILYTEEIYRPILSGNMLGNNFKEWWIEHVDTGTDTTWQRSWFYGLTLLGDPCFQLKNSATFISGDLEGILSVENSPYFVTDDITIPQGSTLEIEAGCELIFMESDIFWINGKLLATGTADSLITFSSQFQDEYWKGLT